MLLVCHLSRIRFYENEMSYVTKRPEVRPTYDILCEAIKF